MVFSSTIFLWKLLPLALVVYYVISKKFRNVFLLIISLTFYAWGEPVYIGLMLFCIVCNYIIGLGIDWCRKYKKSWLLFAIILNLGLLGYFKYYDFFASTANTYLKTNIAIRNIVLPIGISFFTFQSLSYVIDVYRGKTAAQKSFIDLALYISFFPQLIAGPIVRYNDINEQLKARQETPEKIADGIRRFIYGLAKKVLIANVVAEYVDKIYAMDYGQVSSLLAWIAAILYMLQIYYDFSGYSDMAIGLGKIFGFDFLENFHYPYLSKSIQEFWKRWHISLGAWFREYLYIPLGGNRKGTYRTYINLFIVFFMTGLWHGASFTFVLWGLYHGFFSVAERLGLKKILNKVPFLAHVYTTIVVVFGWVLFRADGIHQAGVYIKRMLMPWKYLYSEVSIAVLMNPKIWVVACCGILGIGIIQTITKKYTEHLKYSGIEVVYCGILLVVCLGALAANSYNPFIYFRF